MSACLTIHECMFDRHECMFDCMQDQSILYACIAPVQHPRGTPAPFFSLLTFPSRSSHSPLHNSPPNAGKSERGGHPVIRMPMKQWMLAITKYADRLLHDLDTLDWSESIKDMQRNWIGRSEVCFFGRGCFWVCGVLGVCFCMYTHTTPNTGC